MTLILTILSLVFFNSDVDDNDDVEFFDNDVTNFIKFSIFFLMTLASNNKKIDKNNNDIDK